MIRQTLHRLIRPFLGLQAKACIVLTVIVAITATGIGGTAIRRARTQMLEAAAQQALGTARLVAAASADRYAARDATGLVDLCQHLAANENLLYLAFLDRGGRVVAGTQKPHTLTGLLDEAGQHLRVQPTEGVQIRESGERGPGHGSVRADRGSR